MKKLASKLCISNTIEYTPFMSELKVIDYRYLVYKIDNLVQSSLSSFLMLTLIQGSFFN